MRNTINPTMKTTCAGAALTCAVVLAMPTAAQDTLLISETLDVTAVEVVEITDTALVHLDDNNGWRTRSIEQCIGLVRRNAQMRSTSNRGSLHLVDGQVIPGSMLSNADPDSDTVVWNHAWLSRIEVPLSRIAAVLMRDDAVMPTPGESDVVILANGDRYEGFILDIGDPVSIDMDQPDGSTTELSIPLDRIASIGLVSQQQVPANKRVWFTDGSILDVRYLHVGDDGFARLQSVWGSDSSETEMPVSRIAGALFKPGVLTPLASLDVEKIVGPEVRYIVPAPVSSPGPTPLGLAEMTLRGPLAATWRLPRGCRRFAAEVEMPEHARIWGDCELIVRVDGDIRTRVRLNQANPNASMNIDIAGASALTLEISEGQRGSIQDELILRRAMLLCE